MVPALQMSIGELLAGFRYANRRFYSLSGTAKRMWRSPVQIWWTLPLNLNFAVCGAQPIDCEISIVACNSRFDVPLHGLEHVPILVFG